MAYICYITWPEWPLRLYNYVHIPYLQTVTFWYSHLWIFSHLQVLNLHYHTWQACDQGTMALACNSEYIIYYHMDALWSLGLVWNCFAHPNYLDVQCWVHTTYVSPGTINQMGPHTYCYVKFFKGWMGDMPLGTLCTCIMVTNHQTNAVMPSVVTTCPVLWTAPTNHQSLYHKMLGINLVSIH